MDDLRFSPAQAQTLSKARGWSWYTVVPGVHMPTGWDPSRVDLIVGEDDRGHAEALMPLGLSYVGSDADMQAIAWGAVAGGMARLLLADARGARALIATLCSERVANDVLSVLSAPDPIASLTDLSAVVHPSTEPVTTVVDAGELYQTLSREVRGQGAALGTLAERAALHALRIHPKRPLTVFMVGPTGVGKTRTAEALARALTGAAGGHLRLDMSEFQEAHRVSQLFGSPQGYAGCGDGAVLLDTLAAHPRAVVVFDEIDKAHSAITRALMNGMDAGRLSRPSAKDGTHTVDCTRAVFVFTSNQAADEIELALAAAGDEPEPFTVDAVCRRALGRAGVAPEIVGRIGCFLAFRPLSDRTLAEIVTLAIAEVATEYGITLASIDPAVVSMVLGAAHGSAHGARPYEYVIDARVAPAFVGGRASGAGVPMRLTIGPPLQCIPVVLH